MSKFKNNYLPVQVAIMHRDDHKITMTRLCKRWNLSSGPAPKRVKTRRKRFAISNHRWERATDSTIRFNFQNYR